MKSNIILLSLCVALSFCGQKSANNEVLFERIDASESGIDFENLVPENDTLNQFSYNYLFNGNGVAVGDINNDGLPDLYFTGNSTSSKLYLNKGDFKFEDITDKAGVSTKNWMSGVAMADVNNDGFLDIYVCGSGPSNNLDNKRNKLFINNKNATFTESSAKWGVNDPGNATCASFFDMDNDGDLDFYLGNHADKFFVDVNVPFTRNLGMDIHSQQHMFRNDGGKYTDISEEAGMKATGYCLSATPSDFNNDGLTDLYVCNDYNIPDYFYINQGNGKFIETNAQRFKHTSNNSMGCDAADINNDGLLDLITLDMLPENPTRLMTLMGPRDYDYVTVSERNGYGKQYMKNALQVNRGNGYFSDLSYLYGVARTDWSWSPLFCDFNDDGFVDLYISNGYYRDVTNLDFVIYQNRKTQQQSSTVSHKEILDLLPFQKLQNYLYINHEGQSFTNEAANLGLPEETLSTGSAYGDLDGDGDIDLVLCNQGEKPFLYKNIKKSGNFANFTFTSKTNKTAIGVKLIVEDDSAVRIFENNTAKGYQSCSEGMIHVGLGEKTSLKKATFILGNGKSLTLTNVDINKTTKVNLDDFQGSQGLTYLTSVTNKNTPLFDDLTANIQLNFKHSETETPDFKRDPLLPHRYTMMGPGMTTGDVNGDGLSDLFIGNASSSSGSILYLQNTAGKMVASNSQPWKSIKADVMGSLLFDADGDNDLDLYVAVGGAEFGWPSPNYKHQLYKNDGKGNFTDNSSALPNINTSGSSIAAGDYDNDGDLDLFVAGRILPSFYPELQIRSYLLKNNGGKFTDVTATDAPALVMPGMISSAIFTDYNNDNQLDLAIVGEYTPLVFMKNMGGKFEIANEETQTGLNTGWFNSILPIDIDNDNDLDYVLGNKGNNSFLNARPEFPVAIYWTDLDKNGREDLFMSYTQDGKEYPVNSIDEMQTSFPGFLSKKFTNYVDFGGKTVLEIFGQDNLDQKKLTANNFSSMIAINNGGVFEMKALPRDVQSAPIFGMMAIDVNNDGYDDVVGIGNNRYNRVQLGPDDALNGFVLINKAGVLAYSDGQQNGFYVPNDGRSLVGLPIGKKLSIVATQNNSMAKAFKPKADIECVNIPKTAASASVTMVNGQTKRVYIGYGTGYLSGSAPMVLKNSSIKSVIFYNNKGQVLK